MATGRGMSRSIVGSSDVIHDFSCTPCAEDGKNTEAVHYCVNCESYFCQTCIVHHNKVLKSHKLLDKDAMATAAKQTKKTKEGLPLPTKECEDHPGNIVQMFCGTHDVCCCTVCIALEHRACKDVDFIPKLAKGILEGKERHITKLSLEKIRRELVQLKSEKEDELTEKKKTKQDILEEIKQLKERLIERVNELERKSRDEVCETYENIAEHVNSGIDNLNDLLQSVEAQIKCIEQIQSNESELFVAVKYGQKFESRCNSVRQQLIGDNVEEMSFLVSKDIEALLNNVDSLGTVKMTDYGNHKYTATLIGEYNVKVTEDVGTCTVYDVCVLDNDQYIVTDYINNKIKRLDKTFSVTDWCTVPVPWGVCKTGTNELAVTLCDNAQVQFVNNSSKIECTRSFKVGLPCRGIVYQNGKIFVACGILGHPNEVRIYNLSGLLLNTYRSDALRNVKFSFASHIVLSSDESRIHVTDRKTGLFTNDKYDDQLSMYTEKGLNDTFGLCTDDHGNLFVSGHTSHNVFQLDRHGTFVKEILKQSDGIHIPISVTFVTKTRRLLVTCSNSDTIRVFKLT